jgi:hypothetical protein
VGYQQSLAAVAHRARVVDADPLDGMDVGLRLPRFDGQLRG